MVGDRIIKPLRRLKTAGQAASVPPLTAGEIRNTEKNEQGENTMKTLYFEGAGWSGADISKATIGNCRIRTAFSLDDGRKVYLELSGTERKKTSPKDLYKWQYTGFVNSAFYITDDTPNDDGNKHRIAIDKHDIRRTSYTFEWSLAGILELVNTLGASFDAVLVVPDYGGYHVFREDSAYYGTGHYNYGDEFQYDAALTARRAAIVEQKKRENCEKFDQKYDNTNYYIKDGNLMMRYCVSDRDLAKAGESERIHILLKGDQIRNRVDAALWRDKAESPEVTRSERILYAD